MFILLVLLLPLLHNGWFFPASLAKIPPFDMTTDASSLIAFRDHLLATSNINNILRTNWTSASNTTNSSVVCLWIGVSCGSRHQRVVSLNLGDMGLTGTIPPHLGNLSFLALFDISNNNFHGQLPQEMAGLYRLSFVDVSFNQGVANYGNSGFNSFSGSIPAWFGFFIQLKYLFLHNNTFTGPIPPSLSNCSKLENLNIMSNLVNGMIPQQIGDLYNLKHLQVFDNQLTGEIPHSIFNISSLETLRLAKNGISGSLPADLSNLKSFSRLEVLSLSYNKFHGRVPSAFGNLTMLNILFVGGNNLEGGIPNELENLVNLKQLGLERAGLGGSIPPSIFKNMTSLELLNLNNNNLIGSIPQEIGNCTAIYYIDIDANNLTGVLPGSIGRLPKLEFLALGLNNLEGHVLANFFNITSLRTLGLTGNHFTGDLPSTIGVGLPNLEMLVLSHNQLSGPISDSISNASALTLLDLALNRFTGSPPRTLGNLRLLNWLGLGGNNLQLNGTSFIASLNSCKYLQFLDVSFSQVNGPLPSSFGNLTFSLQNFFAMRCGITGKIPQGIGNMRNLQTLRLSSNQFVGSLSHKLQGLSNIEQFDASNNSLSGSIPDDICRLPNLGELDLQRNEFSGPLPDCLGNITTLRYLRLHENKLSVKLPTSLWTLKDILVLHLSSNSFTGYLPPYIETLRAAIYIDLSMNQLSGTLPSEIGSLQTLSHLSLAHNKFEGSIPKSFGKLLSMVELDLSYNNLSGEIPKSLETLSLLKILNLSFNHLSGEIPSAGPFKNLTYLSFESNEALCGSSQFHVPKCQIDDSSKHLTKKRKVLLFVYILMGVALLTVVILVTLHVILKCRMKHRIPPVEDLQPAVTHERISYHEVLRATNSFDDSNLLGKGSFGSVYKGVFADGKIWAVKVFHLQVECAIKSFDTECEVLRNIRHRNLTKVISSCTNLDFMALVLEYMPNGSLDRWLYSHNYILDMKKRLDIMIDVASALAYLHHGYSVPVVHCDLKPRNILLDEDMVAHVSDFGISKILNEDGGIVRTNTLATIGYTAPEYGQEGLVSAKCDVYSFGIMLMEVFTRKRPTEEMFNEDLDLKLWVKQSFPDRVTEVIDENLVRQDENRGKSIVQCVSVILEVAVNCSADSPEDRMNMNDVLASLKKIRFRFLENIA